MHYLAVSALSHGGLVREHNEDSLVIGPWTLCATTTLTPQTIYLPTGDPIVVGVADGLGGHPAGEEASALAVRWLARAAPTLTDEAALEAALTACNDAVQDEAARHPDRTAMGTTIAGLLVVDESVLVFNVGDSRVYAFCDGELNQLSVDDNEPPFPGQRRSSVVTQILGGSPGMPPIEPHVCTRSLTEPERYLVCSDGLTDAVEDADITAVLREHDGGRAAFELWQAAIEAGGPDNITLALVEPVSGPDR